MAEDPDLPFVILSNKDFNGVHMLLRLILQWGNGSRRMIDMVRSSYLQKPVCDASHEKSIRTVLMYFHARSVAPDQPAFA